MTRPHRPRRDAHHCTACGGKVRRAHRTEDDPRDGAASDLRRFACLDAACGWQGLLPHTPYSARNAHRSGRSAQAGGGRRAPARRQLWLLTAGLLGLLTMAVAGLVTMALQPDRPAVAPASGAAAPNPAPALQPRR